ncbi:ferredoxin [Nocardia arthritidis]|uniref:Ferredoxin n=1 Tax=Nocardia arthritidis TaxID=228602 RepID=A0A6C0R434_9NOCA|nr:ferredoxin [Nocardia arthritidis]QHZ99330.1 ferredoxin [Nocardia arthritidis]QIS10434.1 ferredoxin [Nocardia arthritidis]
MHISADRDRCIGVGHCLRTAPDIFDSGADGRVVVIDPEPDPARADTVRKVVQLCPNAAIALLDDPREESATEREET